MAAMHCNREEVVSIAIPDRRFSDTLAVYLLPRLVLTRTLRLLENRLHSDTTGLSWNISGAYAPGSYLARVDLVRGAGI